MTLLPTIARNTVIGLAGQAAVRVFQLVTTLLLARTLGAGGFGDFGYIVAVFTFFQFAGDLGVEKIALREMARNPDRAHSLAGAAMSLRSLLSLAAAGIAGLFLFLFAPTPRLAWLGALACLSLPFSLGSVYPVFYQANLRVGRAVRFTVLQGFLQASLLVIAIALSARVATLRDSQLELVVTALALSGPAAYALFAWTARHEFKPRPSIQPGLWRYFLEQAAPLAFNLFCIMVSLRADQLLLRSIKGAEPLGHYTVALRFMDIFTIVPAVLLLTVFPLMSRIDGAAGKRLEEAAFWSYKALSLFVLPVALAATVLAEPIMQLLFGAAYLPAARPMAILMWSLFFSYANTVTFDAITAAGMQRVLLRLSAITMILNIGLNVLLIPRYGAVGAAVAFLIFSASSYPFLAALPDTRPLVKAFLAASWRPVTITTLLAAAALVVPRVYFLLILVPVYLALLWGSGALTRRDLEMVRTALRRTP